MLPSYLFLRATHLQLSLNCFTHNTLIEVAILNSGWFQILILHQQSYRLVLHSLQFLPKNTEKLDLFTLPYIGYWEPPWKKTYKVTSRDCFQSPLLPSLHQITIVPVQHVKFHTSYLYILATFLKPAEGALDSPDPILLFLPLPPIKVFERVWGQDYLQTTWTNTEKPKKTCIYLQTNPPLTIVIPFRNVFKNNYRLVVVDSYQLAGHRCGYSLRRYPVAPWWMSGTHGACRWIEQHALFPLASHWPSRESPEHSDHLWSPLPPSSARHLLDRTEIGWDYIGAPARSRNLLCPLAAFWQFKMTAT